jgi:glycosyltransferase involved in cell wall biosynthesis
LKSILFIVPYPIGISPGQRFRFEQYIDYLKSENYQVEIAPFFKSLSTIKKKVGLLSFLQLCEGMFRRLLLLFRVRKTDYVFIFREAMPFGPPLMEWIIAKVFKKKIIYDFDDAIWLTDKQHESWLEKIFRCRSKVKLICTWSYKVSCGNEYLCAFANHFNQRAILNPTTIDTINLHNPALHRKEKKDRIVIGWTGSYSTLKYLKSIEQVLQNLEARYAHIEFWVIADKNPDLKISKVTFRPWSPQSEISDLIQFDIGLMPLPDDDWTKGKCGFKALQYMALEIPTIASPVGVNSKIIQHGTNGYLAEKDQWEFFISTLIDNQELREKIGSAGRKTVVEQYSTISNCSNFLSLFC